MSDPILYTYKAPKLRELTDDERAKGIAEPMPLHHPGVPLRDLTAADVDAMPAWLHATIAASDLYEATPEGKKRQTADARAQRAEEQPSKPATKAEKE